MENTQCIIDEVLRAIDQYKIIFKDEKDLQRKIEKILKNSNIEFKREHDLGELGIVDFFKDGVAFEIKIQGQKKSIYRQCKKYLEHDTVKSLVLISSFAMGFPNEIDGKKCYFYRLN